MPLPALTLIAVEEPENNLAPFYLSRIIRQIEDLTRGRRAQAVVSSHSPSILARVDPAQVRHFRLDPANRSAWVRSIRLPEAEEEASKFVREAVRTYPELYFARFAVLGEGASEEVVLPRLAEALGFAIDRSFVAVVPLGGRHVNHLWRLLTDLDIPHATLLDLDWGRAGGGWGRIKTACAQLLENGVSPRALFGEHLHADGPAGNLIAFDGLAANDAANLDAWAKWLRQFGVFFCAPLDLDYSMLQAFPAVYQVVEPGRQGPSNRGDPRTAVLGDDGMPALYPADHDGPLRWYRYLFLGRGKPSTHVRVLSGLPDADLAAGAPEELDAAHDHRRAACAAGASGSLTMPRVRPDDWRPRGIDDLEPQAWRALRQAGCTCVVAGPGAGKTEFLAQRAVYLLETGACPPPYRILAISFKSDAAEKSRRARAETLSARAGEPLRIAHFRRVHQGSGRSLHLRDPARLASKSALRHRISHTATGRRFPGPDASRCTRALAGRDRGIGRWRFRVCAL